MKPDTVDQLDKLLDKWINKLQEGKKEQDVDVNPNLEGLEVLNHKNEELKAAIEGVLGHKLTCFYMVGTLEGTESKSTNALYGSVKDLSIATASAADAVPAFEKIVRTGVELYDMKKDPVKALMDLFTKYFVK